MRIRLYILATFIGLIAATTAIPNKPENREFVESVSTFVCPAKSGNSNTNGVIHVGAKAVKSALIDKKNRPLKKGKDRSLSISTKARVIEGESATPILLASKPSRWLALTQCTSSSGEFWFVGGTSDVSSLGYFQFTNENLGKAIIDIELWSEDGSEGSRTLTIPARSTKNYSLTTFMPGNNLTAFNVISRSGLVNTNLLDERRRGLTPYGADFVPVSAAPDKNVIMVGVPGPKFAKKSKITSQKIRIFVPGETDAIIQVNYLSKSGIFAPVGLDAIRVPAQRVVEVELPKLPNDQLFSLQLRATEPIIASTFTRGTFDKRRELIWSGSAQQNQDSKIALPERSGYLSIVSSEPKVSFVVVKSGGKRSTVTMTTDPMGLWKVPDTAREIQFSAGAPPKLLAITIESTSGVASAPLAPAQSKEVTTLPVIDSTLLIPDSNSLN